MNRVFSQAHSQALSQKTSELENKKVSLMKQIRIERGRLNQSLGAQNILKIKEQLFYL